MTWPPATHGDVKDEVSGLRDLMASYKSGYYYRPGSGLQAATQFLNEIHYVPVWIYKATTFDRIGIEVTTSVASGTLRLGIYSPGSDGRPAARLLDAGTVSSATTGFKEITISQALPTGLHFLAVIAGTDSCQVRRAGVLRSPIPLASQNNASTAEQGGYYESGSSGALPATASPHATVLITTAPLILLRAA